MAEHVRLAVPADPDYGRVIRAAASNLALRAGVAYRRVEDLRLAIDEAVILLLGGAEPVDVDERPVVRPGSGGELLVEFTLHDDVLVTDLSVADSTERFGAEGVARFDAITEGVVAAATTDEPPGHVRITVSR